MTARPYVDHRQIQKWRDECKAILPLEPFIPSRDGFVLGQGDVLVMQLMLESQAAKMGMRGLTVDQAYAVMARLENMPGIEAAAMEAQRDVVLLRRALSSIARNPASGSIAQGLAQAALDETERE